MYLFTIPPVFRYLKGMEAGSSVPTWRVLILGIENNCLAEGKGALSYREKYIPIPKLTQCIDYGTVDAPLSMMHFFRAVEEDVAQSQVVKVWSITKGIKTPFINTLEVEVGFNGPKGTVI